MGRPYPYPAATRQAVEARLRNSALNMKEIAAEAGVPYNTVRAWNDKLLIPARRRGRPPDLKELNAALRAHIAHRIAVLERGLRDGDGLLDPSKVLRDLTGLKRLLDTFAADGAREAARSAAGRSPGHAARHGVDDDEVDGEADGESPQDIAALRASIARRYAAFEAAQAERAVPEDAERAGTEIPRR